MPQLDESPHPPDVPPRVRRLLMAGVYRVLTRDVEQARQYEATAGAISPAPSASGLGPFVPCAGDEIIRPHLLAEDQLRSAEAVAFQAHDPEYAGRLMLYRHRKFGCGHPAGVIGELFGPEFAAR